MGSKKTPRPRDLISIKLAHARDRIRKGKTEKAMRLLDRLSRLESSNPRRLGKIASLVADSELDKGRYQSALDYYDRASEYYAADDERDWFRPALGAIITRLKSGNQPEAYKAARKCWNRACSLCDHHAELLNLSMADLRNKGGKVVVERRPIRKSVVASKLAQVFLSEGETSVAAEFFNSALHENPRGACRARQGLARIALQQDDYHEAEKRATEALHVGKFQAKTVSVWGILISARENLGKRGLRNEHARAILKIGSTQVRARTVFEVCKLLRSFGDSGWETLGNDWLRANGNDHGRIALELNKLKLADLRISASSAQSVARVSIRILASEHAQPSDIISSLKAYSQARLQMGKSVESHYRLVRRVKNRWGGRVARKSLHAMAKGAIESGFTDSAKAILHKELEIASIFSSAWGRATKALADLEYQSGDYSRAMKFYLQYAENAAMPERFSIQALLKCFDCVDQSAEEGADSQIRYLGSQMDSAVARIEDFSTLLDVGRDLSLRGSRFRSLRDRVVADATSKAVLAMNSASVPADYLNVLIKLTRREFSDFRKPDRVINRWNNLSDERRTWLWSEASTFWEYLSLVIKSHVYKRSYAQADGLAADYLNHDNVPNHGYVHVGAAYAFSLIAQDRFPELLEFYREMIQRSPTHRLSAQGYYWLIIEANLKGDAGLVQEYALSLRQCFGNSTRYLWEEQLLARVDLHLVDNFQKPANWLVQSPFDQDGQDRERSRFIEDSQRLSSHI